MIGIGDKTYKLAVYIGKRPPLEEYKMLDHFMPVVEGELARIGRETGNHWRKIINIYAKLAFALNSEGCLTWQYYRDSYLLTQNSRQALLFDDKILYNSEKCISIVCGKAHAIKLLEPNQLVWLDSDFALDSSNRIIVTPYFDYRQLSNTKIEKLVSIIKKL
jgi:hypothetical protein